MNIRDHLNGVMLVNDEVSSWLEETSSDAGEESEIVEIKNGVATVRVTGLLTTDWTWVGYTVSMTDLLEIVRGLEKNETVVKIVYRIDSPGGTAQVMDILGREIAESSKDTVSIVDGMAASGAYWLASQTNKIIVTPLSQVGSIGAVVYYWKDDDRVLKFTSKNAPVKASNGKNEAEIQEIQQRLNDIEGEFISAVASGRNVEKSEVIENYGKGGMFLGRKAVEIGMADKVVETYDELEKELVIMTPNDTEKVAEQEAEIKTLTEKVAEQEAEHEAEIKTLTEKVAETNRIKDIMSIDAPGNEALILAGINDPDATMQSVMQDIIKNPALSQPLPYGIVDTTAPDEDVSDDGGKIWKKNGVDKDGLKVQDVFSSKENFLAYNEINRGEFK